MKRLFKTWVLMLALTLLPMIATVPAAHAVDVFQPCGSGAGSSAVCKDVNSQGGSNKNPIVSFLKIIIQIVALVVGIASVIVIIVSGIRMVASAGDTQAATNARNGILYAVIGIVVALIAEALVAYVLNKLQ